MSDFIRDDSGASHDQGPQVQQSQPPQQQQGQAAQGPCALEMSRFMQCAEQQDDISLCSGFSQALRECKQQYHGKWTIYEVVRNGCVGYVM